MAKDLIDTLIERHFAQMNTELRERGLRDILKTGGGDVEPVVTAPGQVDEG